MKEFYLPWKTVRPNKSKANTNPNSDDGVGVRGDIGIVQVKEDHKFEEDPSSERL